MMPTEEVCQFIEILNRTSPKLVERNPALQEAIKGWFERGDDRFHHRWASKWCRKSKKSKPRSPRSDFRQQSDTHAFFLRRRMDSDSGSKTRKRRQTSDDVELLVKATQVLQEATMIDDGIFGAFWTSDQNVFDVNKNTGISRQHCLAIAQNKCESNSLVGECRRRVLLGYAHHEIQSLSQGTDNNSFAAAARQFAELSHLSDSEVDIRRRDALRYMELATHFGPGSFLMAGSDSRKLWRKIPVSEIGWLWDYCNAYSQDVIKCAEKLSPIATSIILSGMPLYGANVEELHRTSTLMSNLCKPYLPMQALVTAASIAETAVPTQNHTWSTDGLEPVAEPSGDWIGTFELDYAWAGWDMSKASGLVLNGGEVIFDEDGMILNPVP